MKTKITQLLILAVLTIIIIITMIGCSQNISPADRYAKTWSDSSFEARMKSNTAYSRKNAKDALQDAKDDFREKEKSVSQRDKISKIWDKTAQLKAEKND